MPARGPEYRFKQKIREKLTEIWPEGRYIGLVDAYRSGTKDCDFLWIREGMIAGIELKSNKTEEACLKKLTDNQKSGLDKLARAGCCALLICEYNNKKEGKKYCSIYKFYHPNKMERICENRSTGARVALSIESLLREHYRLEIVQIKTS